MKTCECGDKPVCNARDCPRGLPNGTDLAPDEHPLQPGLPSAAALRGRRALPVDWEGLGGPVTDTMIVNALELGVLEIASMGTTSPYQWAHGPGGDYLANPADVHAKSLRQAAALALTGCDPRLAALASPATDDTAAMATSPSAPEGMVNAVRDAVEGWWVEDDVDAQAEALHALCGDHADPAIRCAVANLRNANRILRTVRQAVGLNGPPSTRPTG